ncbi:MAG: DUF4160 domain-containing protein [Caldilineaceae bacterium]
MNMPCICEFDGIQIYMYVPDHNPPHFHVRVGGIEAQIDIANAEILRGTLNRADRRKVVAWARKRRHELARNWQRIEQYLPPEEIAP